LKQAEKSFYPPFVAQMGESGLLARFLGGDKVGFAPDPRCFIVGRRGLIRQKEGQSVFGKVVKTTYD
jgi:hypothetical protein